MNAEQIITFIRAAQLGIACGLTHPVEWYVNAVRALDSIPYNEIAKAETKLLDAFLAFFRGTGAGPGDPVESWNQQDFIDFVNQYYKETT